MVKLQAYIFLLQEAQEVIEKCKPEVDFGVRTCHLKQLPIFSSRFLHLGIHLN